MEAEAESEALHMDTEAEAVTKLTASTSLVGGSLVAMSVSAYYPS